MEFINGHGITWKNWVDIYPIGITGLVEAIVVLGGSWHSR